MAERGITIGDMLARVRDYFGPSVQERAAADSARFRELASGPGGLGAAMRDPSLRQSGIELAGDFNFLGSLEMGNAARLARAAEQGFDVERPLYHGTGRDFPAFSDEALKNTGGGLIDKGFFASEDPAVASRYAADFNPEGGGNVLKGYLRARKPAELPLSQFGQLQRLEGKIGRGEPLTETQTIDLDILGEDFFGGKPLEPSRSLVEQIRERGFDAIRAQPRRGSTGEQETMFFEPGQFRSVNAEFDPAKLNSRDLLAAGLPLGFLLEDDKRPKGIELGR